MKAEEARKMCDDACAVNSNTIEAIAKAAKARCRHVVVYSPEYGCDINQVIALRDLGYTVTVASWMTVPDSLIQKWGLYIPVYGGESSGPKHLKWHYGMTITW